MRFETFAIIAITGILATTIIAVGATPNALARPISNPQLIWALDAHRPLLPGMGIHPEEDARVVGKDFEVDIRLRPGGMHNEVCTGTPYFAYEPGRRVLDLYYGSGWISAETTDSSMKIHSRFTFECDVKASKEPRMNGFGARAIVDVRHDTSYAVEAENMSSFLGDEQKWHYVLPPGDVGSQIDKLRMRVIGTIGAADDGLIKCYLHLSKADSILLEERHEDQCAVKATIKTVQIVNISNAQVIATLK